jgi:hypothetical protein
VRSVSTPSHHIQSNLEDLIHDAYATLIAADNRDARRAAFQRMRHLIQRRTPNAVRCMEIERGLAVSR